MNPSTINETEKWKNGNETETGDESVNDNWNWNIHHKKNFNWKISYIPFLIIRFCTSVSEPIYLTNGLTPLHFYNVCCDSVNR